MLYTTYTDSPRTPEETGITNVLYTSIPSYTTSDHVRHSSLLPPVLHSKLFDLVFFPHLPLPSFPQPYLNLSINLQCPPTNHTSHLTSPHLPPTETNRLHAPPSRTALHTTPFNAPAPTPTKLRSHTRPIPQPQALHRPHPRQDYRIPVVLVRAHRRGQRCAWGGKFCTWAWSVDVVEGEDAFADG